MITKTVGLTGGIGSGKTYISKILKLMGIPIYDSDSNAKRLMTEDKSVIAAIIDLLGPEAYDKKSKLNTEFIASKVFNDDSKRKKLNKIVHPAVRNDFIKFVKSKPAKPIIVNEAALFVENGSYKDFDALISVVSPQPLRIKRIIERDSISEDQVIQRIKAQSSDEEKIKVSDFIIYNDATDNLLRQISEIHAELLTFTKKKENDRN